MASITTTRISDVSAQAAPPRPPERQQQPQTAKEVNQVREVASRSDPQFQRRVEDKPAVRNRAANESDRDGRQREEQSGNSDDRPRTGSGSRLNAVA